MPRRQSEIAIVEALEDRRVLAVFGTPWPNPRSLSVSFPSDSASIGAHPNSLRYTLDQVTDRRVWQEAVLHAFQSWAVQANLNVGLVPDRGDALGATGLSVNDPRFGEFRIGAFAQTGVLASALPYQRIAGAWSGNVLLNTDVNWFFHQPGDPAPPQIPQPNDQGPAVDLYSVLLHEAGNALGIADNNVRGTVMFTDYERPKHALTTNDIADVRRIYGPRRDIYEPVANGTRSTATAIEDPAGYSGRTPLIAHGSLNTLTDVDFYQFRPMAGAEKVNIRLRAAGISLVAARLEVYDSSGQLISDVKADSIFENNLQLEIGSLQTNSRIFVRVASNRTDVFGIGDYQLELDYRPSEQQPSIVPPAHDADAEDEDDDLTDYVSLDQLFSGGLVDSEWGSNDTLQTATVLETPPGFLPRTRYEAQSAISRAEDRDFFRIVAPAVTGGLMQVDVSPLGNTRPDLEIAVMNAAGDRVAAILQKKPDGSHSLQIRNPVAGAVYLIGVRASAASMAKNGNYLVTVDFATDPAQMRLVFSDSVSGALEKYSTFDAVRSGLFRFDLAASGASTQGVQLTFYDARTRDLIFSLSASGGSTISEYIWLPRGQYVIRATARARSGLTPGSVFFTLRADLISDDQGPTPQDPTIPLPDDGTDFVWIDEPPTTTPVITLPPPLFRDPWYIETLLAEELAWFLRFYQ